jgi:threonine/homoserine/homoserine lactone efflux protein
VTAPILAFLGVAAVVIVSPGPDTALTIRNTLRGGRRGGILTGAGAATGQVTWALATSLGVAALLQSFRPAYAVIKFAGVLYLVYLGTHSLVVAWRDREGRLDSDVTAAKRLKPAAAYRQGILSNLSNPKMAVFYISLLPQFVSPSANAFPVLLALGVAFSLMTFVWLAAYSFVVAKVGDILRRGAVRRLLDALTGVALIGLGIRVATERA